MKSRSAEALAYGKEIKNAVSNRLNLTPKEKGLFGQVDVYARPNAFFERIEREEELPFQLMGEAPYQPFAGLPYNRPHVNVREKPIVPGLTFGNIQRFGDEGYVLPETVLPHEIGHVASQILNPEKHQSLKYTSLDDENFAMSFDDAVSNRGKKLKPVVQALLQKPSDIDSIYQRFLFDPS